MPSRRRCSSAANRRRSPKTIRIAAQVVEGGQRVRLSVEDNGVGIEQSLQRRVFDAFYTTKLGERGIGLGLSVSHGIIAEYGGRLGVSSTPGAGTRFTIELDVDAR